MTWKSVRYAVLLAALGAALLTGCGSDTVALASLDPATTEVEYRFNDSSVPPEYHRSYTVTARSGTASIVVDAYGDILAEESAQIDDDTWRGFLRSAASLDLGSGGDPNECAGGTSQELAISEADADPILDVQVAVCGDDGQSEADAIEEFVAPLLDLFDLETLLAPSD